MATPKQKGVLYLARNRFDFYLHGGSSVVSCNLPPTAVKDLDIKNEEELAKIISSFIQQNKLTPAFFLTILSHDILFEKDILDVPESQAEIISSEFVENVPFENTISKMFKVPNGYRIVATNGDFYEVVKRSFEKNGFVAVGAVADFILGGEIAQASVLDLNGVKFILQKFDMLKTQFLTTSEIPQKPKEQETPRNEPQPPPKSSLPFLLGVFGILLLILIVLFVTQSLKKIPPPPNPPPPQVIAPTIPPPTASVSAVPSISPPFFPSATKSGSIQSLPQL